MNVVACWLACTPHHWPPSGYACSSNHRQGPQQPGGVNCPLWRLGSAAGSGGGSRAGTAVLLYHPSRRSIASTRAGIDAARLHVSSGSLAKSNSQGPEGVDKSWQPLMDTDVEDVQRHAICPWTAINMSNHNDHER